jgi:hypothetical protein
LNLFSSSAEQQNLNQANTEKLLPEVRFEIEYEWNNKTREWTFVTFIVSLTLQKLTFPHYTWRFWKIFANNLFWRITWNANNKVECFWQFFVLSSRSFSWKSKTSLNLQKKKVSHWNWLSKIFRLHHTRTKQIVTKKHQILLIKESSSIEMFDIKEQHMCEFVSLWRTFHVNNLEQLYFKDFPVSHSMENECFITIFSKIISWPKFSFQLPVNVSMGRE